MASTSTNPQDVETRQLEIKKLKALLKEARNIIRASGSRQLSKDWDARATEALKEKA